MCLNKTNRCKENCRMKFQKIVDDIYRLAVNIEDESYLFEGIWPIPHGISINAYLIKGKRTSSLI